MAIGTGPMELELWQMLLMAIGAGAILLLVVMIIRDLLCRGAGQDVGAAKKFEIMRRGARIGTSCWVAGIVMAIAIAKDLVEAAVPWHELLMILGVGAVAFTVTELIWALCRKALAKLRAPISKA
ncbi:MAG: hypothetical protein KGZ66_10835 [Selenomonadales bacterium]|nr:hypothetical protein [Selenomonadales bacterium]